MIPGMTDAAAQAVVDAFNRTWPPGSPVLLVLDFGEIVETMTVGPAHILCDQLMVSVVGYGQYKLDRVIPLPSRKPTQPSLPLPLTGPLSADQIGAARAAKTKRSGWTDCEEKDT